MGAKINLGSGVYGIKGWINIDKDFRLDLGSSKTLKGTVKLAERFINVPVSLALTPPPNYMSLNLLKCRLPFEDGSVSYCYTSHFLEHMPRHKALQLLREVHRVMEEGGVLRVIVPDLDIFVERYAAAKRGDKKAIEFWKNYMKEDFDTMTEKFNFVFAKFPTPNTKWGGYGNPVLKAVKRMFVADMDHQWMYDFEDLSRLLKSAGFKDIKRLGFRKGSVPDIRRLDNRENESLYVEARR